MARVAALVCAVLAAVGAALFLTLGPSVTVHGMRQSCPGVIVASETGAGGAACDRVQTRWTWDAVGLGLVSLVAGLGAASFRREEALVDAAGAGQASSVG